MQLVIHIDVSLIYFISMQDLSLDINESCCRNDAYKHSFMNDKISFSYAYLEYATFTWYFMSLLLWMLCLTVFDMVNIF